MDNAYQDRINRERRLNEQLWSVKDERPEIAAAKYNMGKREGIPVSLVQSEDNRNLEPRRYADGLNHNVLDTLGDNPDPVPVVKDQLGPLNRAGISMDRFGLPVKESSDYARKGIYDGVRSAERNAQLAEHGFTPTDSPFYFRDKYGKVVNRPVIRSDVIGKKQSDIMSVYQSLLDKADPSGMASLLSDMEDSTLSGNERKALYFRAIDKTRRMTLVAREMARLDPKWNSHGPAVLRRAMEGAGKALGVDVSDMDPEMFRKGGISSADPWELLNFYGAVSIKRSLTGRTAEELASVDENSDEGLLMDAAKEAQEQLLSVRGLSFAGNAANSLYGSIRMILELALALSTDGTAPAMLKASGVLGDVAAKTAVKKGLKEAGKGVLKSVFTKGGLKKAAKTVGKILMGRALEQPWYVPGHVAEAVEEMRRPVLIPGKDGVEVEVPRWELSDLFDQVMNRTVSRYVEDVSEMAGDAFPVVSNLTKFAPEWAKAGFMKGFMEWLQKGSPKAYDTILSRIAANVPVSGVFGEIGEEEIENIAKRTLTIISKATGAKSLDMGEDSFLMGGDEALMTAMNTIILKSGTRAFQYAAYGRRQALDAARRSDMRDSIVDSIAKSGLAVRSEEATKDVLNGIMNRGETVDIEAGDMRERMESSPEFYEELGVTPEAVAVAEENAVPITLSEVDIMTAQAKSPENREEGNRLFGITRIDGRTLDEAMDPERAEEAARLVSDASDKKAYYQGRLLSYAAAVKKSFPKLKNEAIVSYAKIYGTVVNFLDDNTTSSAEIEKCLDALEVSFYKGAEEGLAGDYTWVKNMKSLKKHTRIRITDIAGAETLGHETFHWIESMADIFAKNGVALPGLLESKEAIAKWVDGELKHRRKAGVKKNKYLDDRMEISTRAFLKYLMSGSFPEGAGPELKEAFDTYRKLLEAGRNSDFIDFELSEELESTFGSWFKAESSYDETPSAYLKEFIESLSGIEGGLKGLPKASRAVLIDLAKKAGVESTATIKKTTDTAMKNMMPIWESEADNLIARNDMFRLIRKIKRIGGLDEAHSRLELTRGDSGLSDSEKEEVWARADAIMDTLKKRGLIFTDWGSKGNKHHVDAVEAADKANFRSVKEFLEYLATMDTETLYRKKYIDRRKAEFLENFDARQAAMTDNALQAFISRLMEEEAGMAGVKDYQEAHRKRVERIEKSIETATVRDVLAGRLRSQMGGAEVKERTNLLNNARTFANQAAEAIRKKDWFTALKKTSDMAVAIDTARIMKRVRKNVEQGIRTLKRSFRVRKGTVDVDEDTVIKEIAYMFGLTDKVPWEYVNRDGIRELGPMDARNKMIEDLKAEYKVFEGEEPDFNPILTTVNRVDIRDLSMNDFNDLVDFVKLVYGRGRKSVLSDKKSEKADIDARIFAYQEFAKNRNEKYKWTNNDDKTLGEAIRSGAGKLLYSGANLRFLLEKGDGFGKGKELIRDVVLHAAMPGGSWKEMPLDVFIQSSSLLRMPENTDVSGLPALKNGDEWKPEYIAAVGLVMDNRESRESLKREYGWSDADLETIAGRLTDTEWESIRNLRDKLDNYSGVCMGLWGELQEATSEKTRYLQDSFLEVQPILTRLYENTKEMDLSGLPSTYRKAADGKREGENIYTHGWTPEMVISACLNMGNSGNRKMLTESFGWTEEDMDTIARKLSVKDWSDVQALWDFLSDGELSRKAKDTFYKENHYYQKEVAAEPFQVAAMDYSGKTPKRKVISLKGGYYPLCYAYRAHNRPISLEHKQDNPMSLPGSMKLRQAQVNDVVVDLHLGVLNRHIDILADYAARRMALRKVLGVVQSSRFRESYSRTCSNEAYAAMLKILGNMANIRNEHEDIDGLLAWGRRAMTAKGLGFNISSTMKQFSSSLMGAVELGEYAVRAWSRNPMENYELTKKSAIMRNRRESFEDGLRNSTLQFHASSSDRIKAVYDKIAYASMRVPDLLVANNMWAAAYAKALSDGKGEKGAILYADDFVTKTQGSSEDIYRSSIQNGKIGRLMCPFMTAVNAQWNLIMTDVGRYREGVYSRSEFVLAMLFDYAMPTLSSAFVAFMLYGGLSGDEDRKEKAWMMFTRSVISDPFGGMPVIRDIADLFANYGSSWAFGKKADSRWSQVFSIGALEEGQDLAKNVQDVMNSAENGNWSRALYVLAKSASELYGTPMIDNYERFVRIGRAYGMELPVPLTNAEYKRQKGK